MPHFRRLDGQLCLVIPVEFIRGANLAEDRRATAPRTPHSIIVNRVLNTLVDLDPHRAGCRPNDILDALDHDPLLMQLFPGKDHTTRLRLLTTHLWNEARRPHPLIVHKKRRYALPEDPGGIFITDNADTGVVEWLDRVRSRRDA